MTALPADQSSFFQLVAEMSNSLVQSSSAGLDHAINDALAKIGAYFNADRSYLFQFDASLCFADNTHEWCAPLVSAQKDLLQRLPVSIFSYWIGSFEQGQYIQIDDIAELDKNSAEYQLLASQQIRSVLMLPLLTQSSLTGMFGVDLVRHHYTWCAGEIAALQLISGNICGALMRQRAERKAESLALYDQLTALANRQLTLDRLQQAIANCGRQQQYAAVLFIDVDNFKQFNDSYGYAEGDLLLRHVGQTIQHSLRQGDTLGRFAADEFVVILEQLSETSQNAISAVKAVAEKIMQQVQQQYQRQHICYHASISIGISLFNDASYSADMLITQADMAMFQAKAAGRNALHFFDPLLQANATSRTVLDNELRQAIAGQQFVLYYQLQLDAQGQLVGAEALIRWQHPQRGVVNPGDFIGYAEQSGLIVAIGDIVLQQACRQLQQWQQDSRTAGLTVAVNISARQFRQADFVSRVIKILQESGAKASGLTLELTESMLISDIDDVRDKMQQLSALGLEFSLDDFGTGYSSLAYLKKLPLNQLKIDRGFVRDILTDSNDEAIARMIIALGTALGLSVLAEGIETPEQLQKLKQLGCQQFQGYLLGKPQPVEHINSALLAMPVYK
ncbi:MAG: EAL domain-containing protein [Gammaproteobacteria bacterium]|nr:EAL domain-containing protein [Gammaproteobacteria bacterium]